MGLHVHMMLCLWDFLSMGIYVHGRLCPWVFLSMGLFVYGTWCPWDILSGSRVRHMELTGTLYWHKAYNGDMIFTWKTHKPCYPTVILCFWHIGNIILHIHMCLFWYQIQWMPILLVFYSIVWFALFHTKHMFPKMNLSFNWLEMHGKIFNSKKGKMSCSVPIIQFF